MAVRHGVTDTDKHFLIDPVTRTIINESGKLVLIQYDHNSERFTFECPRYVDDHDMSLCNRVEIHFINTGIGDSRNSGVYEIRDLQVSPDDKNVVTCSWLISQSATEYVGKLNFVIRFACTTEDGTIEYAWNTGIYSDIVVSKSIYNGEDFVRDYVDVLEMWKQDLYSVGLKISSIEQTVTSDEPGGINVVSMTMTDGSVNTFQIKNGSVGPQGASVSHEWDGTILKVTSAAGTSSADLKGETGEAFTYDMFTPEQLASLKGEKGDTFTYDMFTPEQLIALKGEAFTYDMFTPEQLAALKGEKGEPFTYDMFTPEQLAALKGAKGDTGTHIVSIERTSGTGASGSVDEYTLTTNDGTTFTFSVYNGADGDGAGDMLKKIYDPNDKNTDVFAYVDNKVASVDFKPDWNENDENVACYIKNRTHWIEEVLWDSITIIEETTDVERIGEYVDPYMYSRLVVKVDGVEYKCEPYYNDTYSYCLGDSRLDNNDQTNPMDVPFFIYMEEVVEESSGDMWFPEETYSYNWYFTYADGGAHTIEIVGLSFDTEYHPLDENYIPNTIARTYQIPTVKKADWNQNSSYQADYINNRTHWVDAKGVVHKLDNKYLQSNVEGQTFVIDDVDVVAKAGAEIYNGYESNKATGTNSHAEGSSTTASGDYSHAEGRGTTASENDSHAEGFSTTASGTSSHAEGNYTTASGDNAHAEGYRTEATHADSHAEGSATTATNEAAHAEGISTTASGSASHAEGYNTTASGYASHAEGASTTASGEEAHAEGKDTIASGWRSHTEGQSTTATAQNSHAEGTGTTATSKSQHVQGEFNIPDENTQSNNHGTYAHIVGNGKNSYAQSNAHTLDWEGNAWYSGDVYVRSTSGKNKDDGSKKLATEDFVQELMADIPSWESYTLPSTNSWCGVAYGNGIYVAIARVSNITAYTSDGINWTETTNLPSASYWLDVVYGKGVFVAISSGSEGAYSTDGINWTAMEITGDTGGIKAITYGNGIFVVTKNNSDTVYYSSDGINWNMSTLPRVTTWYSVTYGNGVFVAVSRGTAFAAYSTDGINWLDSELGYVREWTSVAYGNGVYVAIVSGSTYAAYSTNGIEWNNIILPTGSTGGRKITYGNGGFMITSYSSDIALYSKDGITWTQINMPYKANWSATAYGEIGFVAVCSDSNEAAYARTIERFAAKVDKDTIIKILSDSDILLPDSDTNTTTSGLPVAITSGTDSAYTATVDGITELTDGLTIVMIPHATNEQTATSLNINGLGAKPLRRAFSSTFRDESGNEADLGMTNKCLMAGVPVILIYSSGNWILQKILQNASDIKGTVSVINGGTGRSSLTSDSFLIGNGTYQVKLKTPAEALAHMGITVTAEEINEAVASSKTPSYSYGTEDLEAGVSELESGKLYFVYE